MRNDLITSAIYDAQGYSVNESWTPPELLDAIQKAETVFEQNWHNEHLHYSEEEWSTGRLASTCDKETQQIIDAIEKLKLPLHIITGKGRGYFYNKHGNKEWFEHEMLKVRNPNLGIQLKFHIESLTGKETSELEPPHDKGKVKGQMLTVDTHRQGSFWVVRKFLIDQLKPLFLETLGYSMIYGEAMYSVNSEIKGKPPKEKDWRYNFSYVGLDDRLQPIYINNLVLLYYRCGYIANPYHVFDQATGNFPQQSLNQVCLMSEGAMQGVANWLGTDVIEDLLKYKRDRASKWQALQRQRHQKISPQELEEKKQITHRAIMENQKLLDQVW